jgi:CRP-like cAMP-binding protein
MLKYSTSAKAPRALFDASIRRGTTIDFTGHETARFRLVDGWAAAFAEIAPGCRQILGFHLPGDVVTAPLQTGPLSDIGVLAISDLAIEPDHESVGDSWESTLKRERALTAWLINISRRTAIARIAHLLCEFQARVSAAAGNELHTFRMPILQEHIADATGITPVHANRMLRELRERSLAEVTAGGVTIFDLPALRRLTGFDGRYLGLVLGSHSSSNAN